MNNNNTNSKNVTPYKSDIKSTITNLSKSPIKQYQEHFPTEFEETAGGMYDTYGCYILPDGSFWDPNLVYFNKDGLDSNGGFYDEEFVYNPGPNWNDELQCYDDEEQIPENMKEPIKGGIQDKLVSEYENNKNLFRTARNINFDIEDVEYKDTLLYEADNNNELIQSFLEAGLIEFGELSISRESKSLAKEVDKSVSKFDAKEDNQKSSSPKDLSGDLHCITNENQNPNNPNSTNNFSLDGNSLMTDFGDLGTPFKTRASVILKEEGVTPYSIKKTILTEKVFSEKK